jgi:3-oxoacyl-[acyl-carrier-protein] synthase-3
MVHGELNIGKSIEINTATGLCNSGMNALNYGFLSVKAGVQEKQFVQVPKECLHG